MHWTLREDAQIDCIIKCWWRLHWATWKTGKIEVSAFRLRSIQIRSSWDLDFPPNVSQLREPTTLVQVTAPSSALRYSIHAYIAYTYIYILTLTPYKYSPMPTLTPVNYPAAVLHMPVPWVVPGWEKTHHSNSQHQPKHLKSLYSDRKTPWPWLGRR